MGIVYCIKLNILRDNKWMCDEYYTNWNCNEKDGLGGLNELYETESTK